jgi:hypothetical protein
MSLSSTKVGRQMPKLRGKPGWPPRVNQVTDVSPKQKPGHGGSPHYFCKHPSALGRKPMKFPWVQSPDQPLDI